MRKVFLLLLVSLVYKGYSQVLQDRELPIRFGISPMLYILQTPSQFENKISLSPAAFVSYRMPAISLMGRSGFRIINYTNLDTRSQVRAQEVVTQIGIKLHHPRVQNTNVIFAYTPTFVVRAEQVSVGSSIFRNPIQNFLTEYSTPLHHAAYAGLELDLSSRNSLELGYAFSFNRKSTPLFINGSPSTVSLTYSINFNLKPKDTNPRSLMIKSLGQLANKGTLYIINRTCETDFTNKELDSLWRTNYTFSKFEIVKDEEVAEIMKTDGTFFFAVIGKYYASKGDPSTTGIYLLDRNGNLMTRPYPYYISINNGLSYCIGLKTTAAIGIRRFSMELQAN
jgi:hypothetical protein